MKNIDKELVDWAIQKIETEYKDDVALLIGQVGGCKIPTDEQNMIFDFFIPSTERGFQMANTFMIEEMGYDLFPISWDRLEGIANIEEPRMIFAFAKGEVIYARTEEDRKRFETIKEQMFERLQDKVLMYGKALEQLETAQEIYQTMLFEEKFGKLRKAAGGVSCFLMSAIASINGTYLESGYMNLTKDLSNMTLQPENFLELFTKLIIFCQQVFYLTFQFFVTLTEFFVFVTEIIHFPLLGLLLSGVFISQILVFCYHTTDTDSNTCNKFYHNL